MVKKTALLAVGIIAALLIVAALRVTRRCGDNDRIAPGMSPDVGTALPSQNEPLTKDEVPICFHAFEEIGDAYSNLQFETMQEIFCSISNNVARLGRDRLDKAIGMLQTSFREQFWIPDVKARQFSSLSEFERFIRANAAAETGDYYWMVNAGEWFLRWPHARVRYGRIQGDRRFFEGVQGEKRRCVCGSCAIAP